MKPSFCPCLQKKCQHTLDTSSTCAHYIREAEAEAIEKQTVEAIAGRGHPPSHQLFHFAGMKSDIGLHPLSSLPRAPIPFLSISLLGLKPGRLSNLWMSTARREQQPMRAILWTAKPQNCGYCEVTSLFNLECSGETETSMMLGYVSAFAWSRNF